MMIGISKEELTLDDEKRRCDDSRDAVRGSAFVASVILLRNVRYRQIVAVENGSRSRRKMPVDLKKKKERGSRD